MSAVVNIVEPFGNLTVIETDKQLSSRGFLTFVASLILVGVMANLSVQTFLSQGAFTEQQLLLQTRDSAAQVQALQQQLSVMAAPATLAERARRLGRYFFVSAMARFWESARALVHLSHHFQMCRQRTSQILN